MADISETKAQRLIGRAITEANMSVVQATQKFRDFAMAEHGCRNIAETANFWNELTNQQKVDITIASLEY